MVSRTDPEPSKHQRRAARRRRRREKTVAVLPTLLTLANAVCGFFSIFFASRGIDSSMPMDWSPFTYGALFIFLGMVCDGLDGRVARLTGATSDLGEQLDSMADMVTFGVAPAFLAVRIAGVQAPFVSDIGDDWFGRITLVIAAIYVACAALRLARFNLEVESSAAEDHVSFTGLPTPGAAGAVASVVLLHQHILHDWVAEHWRAQMAAVAAVAVLFLTAFAMVSRLRYVHVINRYLRGQAPFEYIVGVAIVGLLLAIHLQGVVAAGFVLYAISAPVAWCV
ncbi:MAG: CDP-diacylglycerol--serine O-phosphatidyltransferase, partial [Phycisphaeraceae bacterium]|nr:CDP-diacylglycerol--serine O-phosphatidyltransferase [Phycisphaeraceae bacterium]